MGACTALQRAISRRRRADATPSASFSVRAGGHFIEFLKIAKQTSNEPCVRWLVGDGQASAAQPRAGPRRSARASTGPAYPRISPSTLTSRPFTRSYMTIVKRVTASKGVAGMLDGFFPWGALQAVAKGAVFSWGQAACAKAMHSTTWMNKETKTVISGGVGGFVQGLVMSPLLLLKTRVMTDPVFRTSGGVIATAIASAKVRVEQWWGGRVFAGRYRAPLRAPRAPAASRTVSHATAVAAAACRWAAASSRTRALRACSRACPCSPSSAPRTGARGAWGSGGESGAWGPARGRARLGLGGLGHEVEHPVCALLCGWRWPLLRRPLLRWLPYNNVTRFTLESPASAAGRDAHSTVRADARRHHFRTAPPHAPPPQVPVRRHGGGGHARDAAQQAVGRAAGDRVARGCVRDGARALWRP